MKRSIFPALKIPSLGLLLCATLLAAGPSFADCILRQSDAVELPLGPFVDATDGVTAETALTISQADVRLKKCTAAGDCSAWAQANDAGAATHEENGWYEKDFNATDTNTVGILHIAVHESGALPVFRSCQVVEEAVYDADYAGSATGLRAAEAHGVLRQGTAQGATSTTIQLDSGATFGDDVPLGMTVVACGSTQGYCQSRAITDYVASTDTATVDPWTVTPSGTILYYLFGTAPGSGGGLTAADVWSHATRTLTAFDEDSLTLDIDAAVRAAIGMTSANLDTQLATIDNYIDTEVAAILDDTSTSGVVLANDAITAAKIAADAITSSELATSAINELRDVVIEDQGNVTLGCAIAVILAYAAGDLSTTGSDSTYEDPTGTETRVTGTVASVGNRTATITCPTY